MKAATTHLGKGIQEEYSYRRPKQEQTNEYCYSRNYICLLLGYDQSVSDYVIPTFCLLLCSCLIMYGSGNIADPSLFKFNKYISGNRDFLFWTGIICIAAAIYVFHFINI
jgi:hypothetical protein